MRLKVLNDKIKWVSSNGLIKVPDDKIINLPFKDSLKFVGNSPNDFSLIRYEKSDFDKSTWTEKEKTLFWSGCKAHSVNGFGYTTYEFVRAISKKINIFTGFGDIVEFDIEKSFLDLIKKENPFEKCVALIHDVPHRSRDISSHPIVGLYTTYETTGIKKEWAAKVNEYDFLVLNSKFLINTFKNSGVTIPISYVPLGVNKNEYPLFDRVKYYSKNKDDGNFMFGTYAQMTKRKGVDVAIKAFLKTFPKYKYPNVYFYVKSTYPIKLWEDMSDDRIIQEHVILSRKSLNEKLKSIDCFVFPTRGEGFGLPVIEAMSTGLPVIVTNWGGTAEFINENIAYPLDFKMVKNEIMCEKIEDNTGDMAEPSLDHLCELMMKVYQNKNEAYKKGVKASNYVQRYWSWDLSADKMINTIDSFLKKSNFV
ncbi:MAG TPA: glycosyltransferase family 4 protein [Bacteroidia bacterium]|nr:glycosyltransferase family 4 protein [Bacteroidia bacterium]